MPAVNKHFDSGVKKAAIELQRAKVPYRAIMKQLGMSKDTPEESLGLCQGQLFSLGPFKAVKNLT
jgi:hypothetical protein